MGLNVGAVRAVCTLCLSVAPVCTCVYLASYPGPPFSFAHGGPGVRKYVINVTLHQRGRVHGTASFHHDIVPECPCIVK